MSLDHLNVTLGIFGQKTSPMIILMTEVSSRSTCSNLRAEMGRFRAHHASSQDLANSPGVSHVSPGAVALSQCYRLRVQEGQAEGQRVEECHAPAFTQT